MRIGPYRLFFFSREEARMHVHIQSADGEAKFWIEPTVALANHTGFSERQLRELQALAEEHEDVIRSAWTTHFGSDEH